MVVLKSKGAVKRKAPAVRVMESEIKVPTESKYEILSTVEGLCTWVGKKDSEGNILDCIPVFLDGVQERGPLAFGMVLLADFARDATIDNRYGRDNHVLGNADTINEDIRNNYGELTLKYLNQEFLSRKLSTDILKFIAKRYARNLKMNFPEVASNIEVDGHRIRLKTPPTLLANPTSSTRLRSLHELAIWLGTNWMTAEMNLTRKMPELASRNALIESLKVEDVSAGEPTTTAPEPI